MSDHSKEIWDLIQPHLVRNDAGQIVIAAEPGDSLRPRLRRLVACWNACHGLTTEFLEEVPVRLAGRPKGYAGAKPKHWTSCDDSMGKRGTYDD